MQNITLTNLHHGIIKSVTIVALLFSSVFLYSQNQLPNIVPNPNRGLPFIYALPDNGTDLFAVVPNTSASSLPMPSVVTVDMTFNGEGAGYRALDMRVYGFANSNNLYSVNPITGSSSLVKSNMFTGVAQGVEFYINNATGEEVMFVIVDSSGSGTGGEKLYAFNPNNNFAAYSGYPKNLFGDKKKLDGIAWDPSSGNIYGQTDDDVNFYTIDVTTGETTYAFSSEFGIDGEGLGFAADGNLYIEDDRNGNRLIYQVDLATGDLSAAATLGGNDDVEGIMGNVGIRNDGGDSPNSYGWAIHQLPVLNSTPVNVFLGTVPPDSENPFMNAMGGFGDDANGVDDEDGVTLNGAKLDNKQFLRGETYTLNVKTNGSGKLSAWIDWNGDGDYDTNEKVANNLTPSGNNINVTFTVPTTAAVDVTYARFRYSTQSNLAASYTDAVDGEVEDYKISVVNQPVARDCNCAPLYKDSNFTNPVKIAGNNLQVGAVYRFANVFPTNPHGTVIDALVKIESFNNGASLLDIDVTSSGLDSAFQPRINSTNNNDQSVDFSITFVSSGGNYGDEVLISFYGTPLDIDGDGNHTREYAELNLPDAYFVSNVSLIDISQTATMIRGEARNTSTAPGGDVSLDPRYTYSNYWENKSTLNYRIGKLDGNSDRYYSLDVTCAGYNDPNTILLTYPALCGTVKDDNGSPLPNVDVTITGSDGSVQNLQTDSQGKYKGVALIPEDEVEVTYEIRESDPLGYVSISDVDGANDNLITRAITVESSCENDFVDGIEWNFECGDDVRVDEYGYNANCNTTTVVQIPDSGNVYQNVVEIVYKGSNPGAMIEVTDDSANTYSFTRTTPPGTSSNVFVYRGVVPVSTTTITYTNATNRCSLQSVVVYAFRNVPGANANSGMFTSVNGVNDIQSFTIDIASFSGPRNLTVEVPISELTDDGRYLFLKVEAGGISDETILYGPDSSLPGGTCCLAIPTLNLENVPGNITEVTITIDTRNGANGQSVNGQSYIVAGGVNVVGNCFSNPDIALIKTGVFDDNNGNNNAEVGETITYAFSVTNTGDVTLNDITITDPLVSVSGTLSTLAPGETNTTAFTAVYSITQDDINNEEVINQATVEGCYETLPVDPNGNCSGQVDYLRLEYQGSINDALIKVVQHDGQTVFEGVVQPGERFEFYGMDPPQNTLGSSINIFVNNNFEQEIHTSCSEPIGPGAQYGDFLVVKGTSRNNGPLQPIAGDGCIETAVDLSDDNSNFENDPTVVPLPVAPPLILTVIDKTDILCFGDATGSITVEATGGVPPYEYSINGGPFQSSPIFEDLVAGVYTIEVEDSIGNTATASETLNQPDQISIEITKTNASATSLCQNGTATATPSGGVGPYTYLWDDPAGQTTQTAVGLSANPVGGTQYNVTVTDANGCTSTQGVIITCVQNCDAVISVDDIQNVLCKDELTGSATVSASSAANPTATFTFSWNTTPPQVFSGVTSSTIDNLGAGVYTVSVTIDGTLCAPVQESVTITEPSSAVNVTATATDETGPTTNDGTATANASGGTPFSPPAAPYTYLWSPGGETTKTITGLDEGTYTVTVTDANGCEATDSVVVQPGSCRNLTATATPTDVSCNGGNNGSATVSVTGGLGPFTYSWSPGGQTTQTITGLTAGSYTVTVTDTSTLCTDTSTAVVGQPSALSSGIAVTNIDCFGDSTGSLDLTVSGGTQPYSFLWSPGGQTTEDLSGLVAGTYTVTITDANGCMLTDSATVTQPSAELELNITAQSDIVCSGKGSVTVEATGGTPVYTYSIDGGPGQTSGTFNDLDEGTYTVNVIDANGCDDSVTVTILFNCTDAVNDINNTFVDIAVSGNVLTNDEDDEGDAQEVTTVGTFATSAGGSVTINADGSYVYTPPVGFVGEDTFEYSIVDDGNPQATDTATVFIEVLPLNMNTTIANADTAGTEVDTPVDGNVLANDFDPEGDNQEVTTVGTFPTTQGGSITIAADGSFTYTPPAGFTGEDTFTYSIIDDNALPATDSAILTITVNSGNVNRTYANDDAYFGNQGATITANVLVNDSDPEGDDQFVDTTVTPVSGPSNGTLSINADGSFTYTPNDPSFFGTDQFVYEIFDNGTPLVARDRATVVITIFGVNTTDAVNDINNTFVDIAVSGNVLTNDEDDQGDAQEVTTVGTFATSAGGSVTINADGSYVYTPPVGFVGEDTFEYSIVDDGNPQATDTATVFIEVLPLNMNTTIANADTAGTEVDTPVDGNVLANDFDPEGDNQEVTTVGTFPTTQGGSITIAADGSFTYTPPAGFTGEDTFTYSIIDDNALPATDSAILTITVNSGNVNRTYANDDAYFGNQGATITANVLVNDSDPEGDDQFVDTTVTPVSGPSNGTLSINADGSFTYTPNDPSFFGTDQFVYEIFDNGTPLVARDRATVVITIFGVNTTDAVNDINNTFVDIAVSGNVLTNDEDDQGDAQEVTTVGTFATSAGGSVTINADGSYVYTPPVGFVGEDTFEYSIVDDGNPQATDTATVFIEVLPLNMNTTIANADTAGTEVDTPVDGNVLANDFDPEGDNQEVTTVGTFPTTQGGSITIAADGSFTYTPPAGFTGEDTFTYSIIDDNALPATDSAILTITVNSGNVNRTYANDDAYFGNQGATITANVLVNDSDPEGDDQFVDTTVTPVSGPSNGTLSINADGSFTYTPNDPSFFGTDQFVYEIFDNGTPLVARDRATVVITIFGVNTTDAVNDINNTFVDIAVSGNVLTNDEDDQGDAQEVTTVGTFATSAGGSVTINADGSYVYTPPVGFVGEDTFEYSIVDDGNPQATDTATVFIEVLPLNMNTTIANADTAGTEVDTPVDGNVLANDFDPEGDNQEVTTVGTFPTTQGGSITIAADGSFTYTPPAGFTGEDTFTYSIIDDNALPATDSAILTITVNSGNVNRTYANDDAYFGNQGATITANVLVNDSDPEGDDQFVDTTVTPVSGPSNGTLSINADGSFTYTPNDPSFFGTDQFVYEIFDNGTPLVARDRATVVITIFGVNTTDAVNDINNTFVDIAVSGNVLTNDEDDQGDAQEVTTVGTFATSAGGSVTINADGSYVYTPPVGFVGEDTFEYSIVDDGNPQATDTATVFIEVLPILPPNITIANADTAGTEVDTPVDGNVLANDFDPEGDNQEVTTVGTFPTTQGGSITIAADGSFTYTPPAGFTGEDTFTYSITDDNANPATDSAILTITVDGNADVNRTYANDDAYNGNQGAPVLGNVLDNDNDPEGDDQFVDTTVTPVSGPSNGTLSINADGSFTYTPNDPLFFGTDQFVYEIFDNGTPLVARDRATVIITIFGVNTTYAVNDINGTILNTPVPGNVLTNDHDDQGDNQEVTTTGTFATSEGGSVTLNADGSYVYTPPTGFTGTDTFLYSIVDDGVPVATDSATVFIEVLPSTTINTTNAVADTAGTLIDVPVDGNVLANDFDIQFDNQVVTTVGTFPTTQGGSITIAADGSFTYTPPAGFTGVDTFEYSIEDDGTPIADDSAILTIYVYPLVLDNYTIANDDMYYTEVNVPITEVVLVNDSDPEGDDQFVDTTITPISGPSNGTVTIAADGTFTYTPNTDFQGTDQFVYEVFDNGIPVARDRATVTIIIQQTAMPAIALVKAGDFVDANGDNCANVGESVAYTFSVSNQGNVPLGAIAITDPLLEAPNPVVPIVFASGDTNGNSLLDLTEIWIYEAEYALTQADIDAGLVTNQATASGTDVDGTTVTDLSDPTSVTADSPTVVTLCQSSSISVIKNQTNATGGLGDLITYDIVVTNTGNTTITNIEVTDANAVITGGNPIATLAPGDSATVTAEHEITQADIDLGYVENIAIGTGDSPSGTDDVTDVSDTGTDTDGNPITDPETVETPNGDGTTNGDPTDDPTVTVFDQVSSISVIKNQTNATGGLGDLITYDIVVTNTGNTTITNIEVTDANAVITGGNPIATLAPGDSATVTAEHEITQADIDLGYVENIAIGTGDSPNGTDDVTDVSDTGTDTDGNPITDPETIETPNGDGTTNGDPTDDPTVTVFDQVSSISVIKNQTNATGGLGDLITYDIVVTNTGNTTITNIEITDANAVITGGNPIATLAPGDSATVTAEHEITQADIDLGYVENIAIGTGDSPSGTDDVTDVSDTGTDTDGNPITDPETVETPNGDGTTNGDPTDDPTVTVFDQVSSISVIKNQTNATGGLGDLITYDIVVTNTGNTTIMNIEVTDANAVITGGNPIATLAPGDSATVTAEHEITQADIDLGYVENIAIGTGDSPNGTDDVTDVSDTGTDTDGNPITDPETIETPNGDGTTNGDPTDDPTVTVFDQVSSISVIKNQTNAAGGLGDLITYDIVVTNTGNTTITNIEVTDANAVITGGNPIATLAPGDSATVTAEHEITQADLDLGYIENIAIGTGDSPSGTDDVTDVSDTGTDTDGNPITDPETVETPNGDGTTNGDPTDDPTVTVLEQLGSIALIKEGSFPPGPDGGGCPRVGDIINYTFTVMNTGNVSLENVTITDPLPGIVITGGPITLAVGETNATAFTGTYVVTQADVDAGEVVNQATTTADIVNGGAQVSDLSDFELFTDDRPTIVEICQQPVIALVKTGVVNDTNQNGCADPKETITYTFTVYNQGNVTLFNVDIDDPLVNVIGGPITLAPDDIDATTFTATYLITQADIEAGVVINQATASGTTQLGQTVLDLSDNTSPFDNRPTQTELCQNPVIALIKTADPVDENGNGCIDLGETIRYDFVVTNLGNVALTNVTVDDPMVTVTGGPITLAAGSSDTETFSALYTVTQDDVDAGFVNNQATAEGMAPDGTIVTDLSDDDSNFEDDITSTTLCQMPSISLEKSGLFNDENGDGQTQAGETISYMFSVTNTGTVTVYNITLSDPLPGIVLEGGPIAQLNPGETDSTTFTATYVVTEDDIDNQVVINQATATGFDINGNEVSDTSDDPQEIANVDPDGDGEPDDPTVTDLPGVLGVQFDIFNGVTPNQDGAHDYFQILGIENFPVNNVKIYNRWGVLVFETDGYGGSNGSTNVFEGRSNGRATVREEKDLPTGTYFYILTFPNDDGVGANGLENPGSNNYSGYLYLNR